MEYEEVHLKPKYLCRWWMKDRLYSITQTPLGPVPQYEFYCPILAKPLDFIWCLIFGKPKLIKTDI